MSKPYIHAVSSAKRYGGKPEDYLFIHNWFDETKAIIADSRHRALRHHSEGIFLCEKIFGVTFKNSDNKIISTRDIAEMHVIEDFRGFIPTAQDFLMEMEYKDWMNNGKGAKPPSYQKIEKRHKEKTLEKVKFLPEDVLIDGSRNMPFFKPLELID